MIVPTRTRVFFSVLLGIIIFFAGINIGKYVEHINTQTQKVPVPVTPKPVVTQAAITYARIELPDCGVSFVLPSNVRAATKNTPADAQFISETGDSVHVSCESAIVKARLAQQKGASESARLRNIPITKYSETTWTVRTKTGEKIYFEVSRNLVELVGETLKID